ncbi:MAG: TMEM175 family protein [Streptosporangiaceae bacterium]
MDSPDPGVTSRRDDVPRVNRLLTLSDGVIAIALTLLVLQLRVPALSQVADPDSAADLAAQLGKGSAQLVSYGISFYVIAQFWLVHRQIFRLVGEQEDGLEWWNFAFLFTITIMPFTSTLLGAFVRNPLAVDIFALNLLLASLATQAMIVVGRRKGLLISDAKARAGRISAAVVPIVMAVSIALSWWSTAAAMYSWLLMAVAPGIINRWSARHARG